MCDPAETNLEALLAGGEAEAEGNEPRQVKKVVESQAWNFRIEIVDIY